MKKHFVMLIILFTGSFSMRAQQTPFLQWQKAYGGSGLEFSKSIQQTKDGGYIVAGTTFSKDGSVTFNHGGADYWLVKLDDKGKLQWQKTYGGEKDEWACNAKQTFDGGYIIGGYSTSNDQDVTNNHGGADYWIVKTNSAGDIEWQKTYGGSAYDIAYNIQQTVDSGFIVAGFTDSDDGDVTNNRGNSDCWIIKLNKTGKLQWQKSYGGSNDDLASYIQQTKDGGFIVAGNSSSNHGNVTGNHGEDDYWLFKLNSSGELQWQKSFGGTDYDDATGVQQTKDGGYVVAGTTHSNDGDVTFNHGSEDYWIIKTTAKGSLQWQKTLGGSKYDYAYSIHQTFDSGYIVAGSSASKNGDITATHGEFDDYWIVKLDLEGKLQWQKTLGGDLWDYASDIQQTLDSGYVIMGQTSSADGNVTGSHGGHADDYDFWIVKLSPETLDKNIHINAYQTSKYCSSSNSVSCTIKDSTKKHIVRLYRFGVLYDSAFNIIGHVGFHNLTTGAYYATATDNDGNISYSEEADIVPSPYTLNSTSINSNTQQLNWSGFNCADNYKIQFHKQGENKWEERATTDTSKSYLLNHLHPSTTYIWRVASEKRINGIKATGEFSDSVTFTTASSIVSSANNASASALNSNQLTTSPNPAKNSFKIFFNTTSANKINAMLYDVNGKAVWSSGLINASSLNNKTVSTTAFARGVYYLKLMDEDGKLIDATKVVIIN